MALVVDVGQKVWEAGICSKGKLRVQANKLDRSESSLNSSFGE